MPHKIFEYCQYLIFLSTIHNVTRVCVITEADDNSISWEPAQKEFSQLAKLRVQYGAQIKPDRELLDEYDDALFRFHFLTN